MKVFLSIISIILVLCALTPAFAFAADGGAALPDLDFSDSGSSHRQEIAPSRLLRMISPSLDISEAETLYIDSHLEPLYVSEKVSNEGISVSVSGNTLTLRALPLDYTGQNGAKVKRTPVSANILGSEYPLEKASDGAYTLTLNGLSLKEGSVAYVTYATTLSLSRESCELLLNYVFGEARKAKELEEKYNSVLGEYLEKYTAYTEYLRELENYASDLEAYEEYLLKKRKYDEEYAEYLEYLTKLDKYNSDLALYNKYLSDCQQYSVDKAEYDRIYNENIDSMDQYIAYYAQLDSIRASMYAIENIYVDPNSIHGPLFLALRNKEMIALFEKNKNILSLYGVSAETINNLSLFSDDLNDILMAYSDERNKSEEAAFAFYKENYLELRDKFNYLYDSMCDILMNRTLFNHMCSVLDIQYSGDPERAEYTKMRIINVLSHIYLVCRGLDDSRSAEGSWSFYKYDGTPHVYYFPELLASNVILTDTNAASPQDLDWPDTVPSFTLPPLPKEPEKVTNPLPPAAMEEPVPPQTVPLPVEPTPAENPGESPIKLDELMVAADILAELKEGRLTRRDAPEDDIELILLHKAQKLISRDGNPILTVYGSDLSVILQRELMSEDDFFIPASAPEKESDRSRDFTFSSWSLSQTAAAEPSYTPGADLRIYPFYTESDRYYTVTWETPKGVFTTSHKYNEMPVNDIDTSLPSTNTTDYNFDSWLPVPTPVRGNATYEACYFETERKYTVTFDVNGKQIAQSLSYGEIPTPPEVASPFIHGTSLYTFTGWSKTLSAVTENDSYSAEFSKKQLVGVEGGKEVTLSAGSYYSVLSDSDTVNAKRLIDLAANEGKRIDMRLAGVTVSFDPISVKRLAYYDADSVALTEKKSGDRTVGFSISILDTSGKRIERWIPDTRVSIATGNGDSSRFYIYSHVTETAVNEISYSHSEGVSTFITDGYSDFSFRQLYTAAVTESENGGAILKETVLAEGETPTGSFYPSLGYYLSSITVIRADNGERSEISSLSELRMPPCDVTLIPNFQKISYTVTFIVDGKVVSSETYFLGDAPKIPKLPEEYTEDGFKYLFSGWSEKVRTVTENATYTAKYNKYLISDTPPDTGSSIEGLLKYTVLPVAAVALFASALIFASVFAIKKLRKKR